MTNSAPTLIGTNIESAVGFDAREAVRLTFSEPILAGSGWVSIYRSDGTLVQRFDVANSSCVDVLGEELIITPVESLGISADYYITIDAGAVRNWEGNGFAGQTVVQHQRRDVEDVDAGSILETHLLPQSALTQPTQPLQCGCSICSRWNINQFSDQIMAGVSSSQSQFSSDVNLAGSYSNLASHEIGDLTHLSGSGNPVEISNVLGATSMRDQFPGTSSESIGDHRALYMRLTFPDINRAPNTLIDAMADMADTSQFFIGNSRGVLTLSPTFTPIITLPFSYNWLSTYDYQVNGLSLLQEAAKDEARKLGFNPDDYNVNIVRVDLALRDGASWGGGNSVWLAWGGFDVIAHEAGHALGIGHARSVNWSGNVIEYGNQLDQMGGGGGFNAYFGINTQAGQGWVDGNDIKDSPGPGIYRLHAVDSGRQAVGEYYGLRQVVPVDQLGNNPVFTLEYRPLQPGMQESVVLLRNDEVLDLTPETSSQTDGGIRLGQTYHIPGSNAYFTVVNKGDGYVDVAYQEGPFPDNVAPSVTFNATATTVKRFDSVTFSADALDANGDQMVYSWRFSDGVRSTGASFTRSFNQASAGTVTVDLIVSDLRGGVTTVTQVLAVGAASTGTPITQTVGPAVPTLTRPRVAVIASDAFASEGEESGSFTISRIGTNLSSALMVQLAYSGDGVARFSSLPSTVTIAAGQSSTTLTLTPTENGSIDPAAGLIVSIAADAAYDVSSQNGNARLNLIDNDTPVVTIRAIDEFASEPTIDGRDTGVVLISRTGPTNQALTVYYGVTGTAFNGGDFTRLDGQVVIPVGQASVAVMINPLGDGEGETSETVRISLASFNDTYSVGEANEALVTIQDDNDLPTVSVRATTSAATEGSTARLEFTAIGGGSEAITVSYTIGGTSSNGSDFKPLSGTITIPAGGSQRTVELPIETLADALNENDEDVLVTINPSAAYSLGLDKAAQITIVEPINIASGGDRVRVTRHFRDLGRQDPVEAGNSLAFYIYRENTTASKQALVVDFSLAGTATPGVDYTGIIRRASDNAEIGSFTPTATGNSVSLAADVNGIVVELRPLDDVILEGTETIALQLTGVTGNQAFYPLGINRGLDVNLLDNDASTIQVGFASNATLIGEQLDPVGNVRQITVSLNQASSQAVSVRYRPSGGSAEALGSDWSFLDSNGNPVNEGVLTFDPGEITKSITVRIQSDRVPEDRESFGIVLERPTGASLKSGYNTHSVTIYDVIPEGVIKEERWSGGGVFTNNSWDGWVLVEGGYPGTAGSQKTTAIKVADIDPSKLTLWLNGGSIASKDQLGKARLDTVQRSPGTLGFWVEGTQEPKAVKLQLEDTATGILVKALEAKTIETIRSTGTGNSQATFSQSGAGINGVGQTFSTGTLGANDRLTSISIVGPTSGATADKFTLKVWENNGAFNTFAPGSLIATSTNSTSIPNNGQAVFNFSGQQLSPDKVYLFSLTNANGNNHAGFRSSITNVSGNRLEDGRLFSNLTDTNYDLAFNLTLSPPPDGVGTVNWNNATALAIATSSTAAGVGVSSLSVLAGDVSAAMLNEINSPISYVGYLNGLTPAQNVGSEFSRRLTGWITAPATGSYEFYLAADDDARLFVGTGEAVNSKVLVASLSGAVSFQQWTTKASQKSAAINLVQGQRYYIEVQHREGSGSDHLSVGWTGPGISTITPIVGPTILPSADPRTIRFLNETTTLVEGQSRLVLVGLDRANPNASTTVEIEVVSEGTATQGTDFILSTATLTFAPGELTQTVDVSALVDSDNEAREHVSLRLVNANGAQIINPSTHLISITDVNAPVISGITGFSQRTDAVNTLIGQFTATPGQGRTMQSWEIIGGNPRVQGSPTGAFAIDNQGRLTLANPEAMPLSSYQFQLTVRGTDNLGASSLSNVTIVAGGRRIVEERWNGQDAYNNDDWSTSPALSNALTGFDAKRDVANSYSRRVTGIFTVSTTGSYNFWIAADDAARLTIAPYDNPSDEQEIAGLATAVGYQNWTAQDSQQSAPQFLMTGQRYVLRAYHREASGSDHLSVAWSGPGFERRVMAASDFLPAQASTLVDANPYSDTTPETVATYSLATTAATDTGLITTVASNSFTRDNTLGLTGTAVASALVRVYDGDTYLGQTRALTNGTWSLTTPVLSDGSHTLRAEVLDAFGNIAITAPATFTIRTHIPVSDTQLITRGIGSTNVLTTGSSADQVLDVTPTDQGSVAYGVLVGSPFVEQRWSGSSVYNNNTWESTTPTYTGSLTSLVAAQNVGNDYSRRITGSITVPTSGDYTFYVASDDSSRLYLSTDATAANKVQIAGVGDGLWTDPQQWNKYTSQKSAAITLQAGQTYYIEVQHLEGGGGDHASVGWTGPGISQITPIALSTSMVVADALNGAQLVDRSLANANLSAGVSTTYADTSADGRYVVFGTSSASSFGNGGTAFGDSNTNSAAPYSDLLVLDRQSGSMRLATSGSAATTTRSRQSQFVGLTADSQYLIYTTDYAEAIGDFSTPGKSQPSSWVLVEGGYPTASGKSKTTLLRVADIDPAKLSIALAGGSIDNDGVLASVSSPTISRSAGSLSFWVQAYDDVYTKAVKLVIEDTATGIVIKAAQAKYTNGNQANYNWTTSGNNGTVATSLSGTGYGVSLLEVQGANLTDAMKGEGAVAASRDLIAFNLATGEQRLLSHSSASDNKQSQAANLANATLSAGGRYVLFSANDATKLGNSGAAFSDSTPGVADLFATDLQTNQIRLLSHTAASATASAGVNVNLLGTSADDRFAIFSSNDASAFGFIDSASTAADLFAVSLSDGTIQLISRAGSGTPSTTSGQAVGFEKIVGNHVYFTANDATKLGFSSDGDTSKADLFRYNLSNGALDLISRTTSSSTSALNGTYQSGSLTVSPDGRYVAFVVDLPSSFGGFSVSISGGALLMLDTQTGALRILNSSNNTGNAISYGAWSGIANQSANPRYFTADSKSFVWQTTYTQFIAIANKSFGAGTNQQFGSVALALDLSGGLAAAGDVHLSRVLSHTANGVDEIAPSVNLLGVSADSRLAFFSAGDISPFGNDGVAFSDSNTSASDIIAVDLKSRRLELVSGANGASFGQTATYQGVGDGGTVLFSLANANGINTEAGSLSDSNGSGTDILSRRFNLIDLVGADDFLNTNGSGSRSDNITSRNSFTLEAWAKPGMAVELLDGSTVVASKTAAADGRLSWQLTNVANGVHVYSLQYAAEGIPIRLNSALGASSLSVTVQAAAANQLPTGTVTISGTPTQGQTLTAANTLADADGIPSSGSGAIAYQWKANGTAISGATGSSLLLNQALVGKAISVTASYIDNSGTTESVTSAATSAVANLDDAATATLAVTGTAQEGGSLTAALSGASDPDGAITSTTFQWQELISSTWTNLAGANTATLSIPAGQSYVGKQVRVVATTTDVLGGTTSFPSAGQTIANLDTVAPVFSSGGTAAVNENVAAGSVVYTAAATDSDFNSPATASSITYSLSGTDAAAFSINTTTGVVTINASPNFETKASYAFSVVATDAAGNTASKAVALAVSNVNEAPIVAAPLADQNTTKHSPFSFTVPAGAFSDVDAGTSLTYTATRADGSALPTWLTFNATTRTFSGTPGNADVGTVNVTVTASDGSLSASDTFAIAVANSNAAPTGAVTISGTPTQGQTLTAANTLADADGIPNSGSGAITYQWKANGTAIIGATGSTFVLTQAEVGKSISVTASYTDNGGIPESVTSDATSAVANINDAPTGTVTISGTPTQGQTLTASNSLADADGIPTSGSGAIAYQWKADGSAIPGSTGSSLLLTQALVGKAITVTASYTDGGGTAESVTSAATAAVANINDAPTALSLSTSSISENAPANSSVATLSTNDPDTGDTFSYSLVSGTGDSGNSLFSIAGNTLRAISAFDYETQSSYSIRLRSTDTSGLFIESPFTISVLDVNEAPTSFTLANVTSSLAENTNLSSRLKLADLSITDDALGSNTVALSGVDAGFYEVIGSALFLRANTSLNFAAKPSYNVSLQLSDPSLPGSTPLTTSHSLSITDVPPAIPTVSSLHTASSTPTLMGSIQLETGGILEVTVAGTTYTLTNGLAISGTTWTLPIPTPLANGTYDVLARHTDATNTSSVDTSTNELTVEATLPIRSVQLTKLAGGDGAEDSGSAGSTSATPSRFRFSRSDPDPNPLTLFYSLSGSATPGSDYTLPADVDALSRSGSVTIATGSTSVDLLLPTLNNSSYDGLRTITASLISRPSYTIATGLGAATASLVDNDAAPPPPAPVFSISDQSILEGDSGSWITRYIKVSLNTPATTPLSVDLSFGLIASGRPNGTASTTNDIQATNRRLTIPAGIISLLVDLQVMGDTTVESPSEFVYASLSNPSSGATLSPTAAVATITISDDDQGLTINHAAATAGVNPINGSSQADSITGSPYQDAIFAGTGDDTIIASGGRDSINLGAGADRLIYSSLSLSSLTSSNDNVDRVPDFDTAAGDRFQLPTPPSNLWSAGVIAQSTLLGAVQSVFQDRNPAAAGLQPLLPNEAVLFMHGSGRSRRYLLAVNDATAGYQAGSDFLVDITGANSQAIASTFSASASARTVATFFVV